MDNEKMKMLAKSYTPEWKFSTDPGCDEGSAAAIIFQNILNDSEKRLASIMHKHKIQYMNLFDKFKDEPMETAKSYVKFNTVTGAPNAVYVKKGTKVFADSEKTTQRIVFETQDNIAATSAKLSDIYITDSRKEWIEHKSLESDLPFTAFLAKGENLSEHRFIMGFADAFDNLNNLDIELTFSSGENLDEVMEILCGENIRFEALCQEGFVPFDLVERVEESGAISPATIHLVMEDSNLKKDFLAGKECYQIAITAQRASSPLPPDVQISRVTLKLSRQNILPDEVYSSGIMQETGFFRPFGYPMEIYATCEFESKEVFSRKGALVELNFQLDFQEFSRPLPEYELLEEYRRVVMKRAPESPKPIVRAVHADYVILEYRSETGWKRLLTQESAETIASMFNGHKKGEKSLTFTVPEDLLKEKSTNNKPRMRFRLMRADGLYQVPSLVYCPAITEFKFKYRYDHSPILPDYAVTRNNFVEKELNFNVERNYTLFDNLIKEKGEEPTMYLGFDKNPGNVAPLSIFFQLENYADTPV
ncbi:MAG: hypothetical protein FWC91_09145, partial [Defluviitaleaceae bacterium]|nr:hypothetical protein [Defluviitaleaceae bacterium]